MLTLNPVNCWEPLKMEGYNVTGNSERECMKTSKIGQSAAKHLNYVNHGMMKVQRLIVGSSDPKSGANMKKPLANRFFSKVSKKDSGCHEWNGCIMPNGYGQFHREGKTVYSHRVAWELANGPIEEGLFVLHRCDNRKCVNPEHLFLGSFDDNMNDMVEKKRQAHGESNGQAKLTAKDVIKIRSASGTQQSIAENYGVTRPLISMIRNRKIWRYV